MGDVFEAYADAIFRTAGDELARRNALSDALAHPTLATPLLAPQVLAPWTRPMESHASAPPPTPSADPARDMATRSEPARLSAGLRCH